MTNHRSKFLRLLWRQKQGLTFTTIRSQDLDYIVPVPTWGPPQAPVPSNQPRRFESIDEAYLRGIRSCGL
jgi:hypothetical protein